MPAEPVVGNIIVVRMRRYLIMEIREGPVYLVQRAHTRSNATHSRKWSLAVIEAKWDDKLKLWRVIDGILGELKGADEWP